MSSSRQHTPGPWIFAFTPGSEQFADIFTLDRHYTGPGHETMQRLHLATVYTDGADDANARLIAAAPTMFDYLTLLALRGDNEAHEIIKKITGS